MTTALYEVTTNDGRKFRVFCANSAQCKRFFTAFNRIPEEFAAYYTTVTNGIHNVKQWEDNVNHLTK